MANRIWSMIETYYNRRSDDDRQWGPALGWRPAKDRPMGTKTFLRLFAFNLPFYFMGLLLLGLLLVLVFPDASGVRVLSSEDISLDDLNTFLSRVTWIAAACALALDGIVCTALVRAWNRRVARLAAQNEAAAIVAPFPVQVPVQTQSNTAAAPSARYWWTSQDKSPVRPIETVVPQALQQNDR